MHRESRLASVRDHDLSDIDKRRIAEDFRKFLERLVRRFAIDEQDEEERNANEADDDEVDASS